MLVTGASGFIGGRLVHRLIARKGRVACLVRAGSGVNDLRAAGVQLLTGDVTDRSSVERALEQSQASTVFHLAGLVRAPRRDDFTRVNVGGIEVVAAACAKRSVASRGAASGGRETVLVVVSSLSAAGPCTLDRQRVETDVPAPVSHYGRSKLAGEQAAARYAGAVPITIVRPPIVFGPGDRAVLEMFRSIARHGWHFVPARAPGGGDHRVSLVHVDDLVEGLFLAAEKGERLCEHGLPGADLPGAGGQGIYFIAADDNPTYAQLGQAIAAALDKKPPTVIRLPSPLLRLAGLGGDVMARIRRRPGSFRGWINSDKITEALAGSWTCSSARARTHLGWSPAATMADRLHETANWYRATGWL
ncbi:MAG: NAD-dependent epimerase/dehydratase family protein [Phycisphaeraceae bacterium]